MAEVDWNEIDYATIVSKESRTIQIWSKYSGKFLGAVKLDENLSTWTPFFSNGTKYMPINWAVEKLKKSLNNS